MTVLAEYTVGKRRGSGSTKVRLTDTALQHVDVVGGDRIKALDCGDGTLIVPAAHSAPGAVLAEYGVYSTDNRLAATLFTPALEPLGVEPGDTVEVHDPPVGVQLVRGESP